MRKFLKEHGGYFNDKDDAARILEQMDKHYDLKMDKNDNPQADNDSVPDLAEDSVEDEMDIKAKKTKSHIEKYKERMENGKVISYVYFQLQTIASLKKMVVMQGHGFDRSSQRGRQCQSVPVAGRECRHTRAWAGENRSRLFFFVFFIFFNDLLCGVCSCLADGHMRFGDAGYRWGTAR